MTNTTTAHKEIQFEDEICNFMQSAGWVVEKSPAGYDRELALYPDRIFDFILKTQPKEWEKYTATYGANAKQQFIKRLTEQLDTKGSLHILRHGLKDRGANFQLCYFKPNTSLNAEAEALYISNRFTLVRQLHYSTSNENSIDLALFINGIPTATAELKTDLTQTVNDAIWQYKNDRQPKDPKTNKPEPLLQFKSRALVHFAVSSDEVFMTTRLAGKGTFFLPFNLGHNQGKGNPPNPTGYKTSYLWEKVWNKDSWLDIIRRFIHLAIDGESKKETMIFPRYHQLDAVTKLTGAVLEEGVGNKYLIQHSAGSGKSNSIAWLAHRLQSLHDPRNNKIFDGVIVITDRKILNKQLQDTIYQFEHKNGVVGRVEDGSTQLAEFFASKTPIIIVTLQTFPFVIQKVGELAGNKYALIIDEAHSSQTGKAAITVKQVLGGNVDIDPDAEEASFEDIINASIESRKQQKNVSVFAFTATPKAKTLEMFGRKPKPELPPEAFHVYSMKQAIEEGFIIDVLQNYTPYKLFYKLASRVAEDKEVDKSKAAKALSRYVKLHPHNIAQKVEIIVEHFIHSVRCQLHGHAKAMVVTDSRLAATRYKEAMEKYIASKGYHLGIIAAFSGTVKDPDVEGEFTESSINPKLKGRDIADAFDTDEFHVLIVANKYQTGFDQPLLQTMYVDKRLHGVLAVQTLSRLNRICSHYGKKEVFVLDFVNDPKGILESFAPFYKKTTLEAETDPNLLYELQDKLDKAGVYLETEIENFCKIFFGKSKDIQAQMHSYLDPAVDRFNALKQEEQDNFRDALVVYIRLYDFLSQIVPFNDTELEKLAIYGRYLAKKLPARNLTQEALELENDVELTHWRAHKQEEKKISLETDDAFKLKPITEVGTGGVKEEQKIALNELIEKMNDIFAGEDLTDADKVSYAKTIAAKLQENETLQEQAKSHLIDDFRLGGFEKAMMDAIITSMDKNKLMTKRILNDDKARTNFSELMLQMVYEGIRNGGTKR